MLEKFGNIKIGLILDRKEFCYHWYSYSRSW